MKTENARTDRAKPIWPSDYSQAGHKNVLRQWSHLALSLKGKITIIKSLALPKIIYITNILWTPVWFGLEIQKAMNEFVWHGKPNRIQKNVLIQDYRYGGLRHLDYMSFVKAQKISWLKRLWANQNSFSVNYLRRCFNNMTFADIISLSMDPKKLQQLNIPLFYEEVLEYWYETKRQPSD